MLFSSSRFLQTNFLVLSLLLFFSSPVLAQSPQKITVTPVKPAFTFLQGSRVVLDQDYPGTVFVAAGQVILPEGKTLPADLVVVAGSLQIEGTVQQDVWAAVGTLDIQGSVQGNVQAAAGEALFDKSSLLDGSVLLATERLNQQSAIAGDVWVAAKKTELGGKILGNVQAVGETLRVLPLATISGSLTGKTQEAPEVSSESSILGAVNLQTREEKMQKSEVGVSVGKFLGKAIWSFATMVFASFILLSLAPEFFEQRAKELRQKWQTRVFPGIVLLVAPIFVFLMLFTTVVGIPVSIILMTWYIALLGVAWVVPTLALGQRILPKKSAWMQATVAAVSLSLLMSLPLFGALAQIAITVLGLGSVARWWWESSR